MPELPDADTMKLIELVGGSADGHKTTVKFHINWYQKLHSVEGGWHNYRAVDDTYTIDGAQIFRYEGFSL